MAFKRWNVGAVDKEAAKELALICDADPLVTLIAMSRGMDTPEKLDEFLSDDLSLPDPYSFAGMYEAAQRVRSALEKGEKITVFGDYDCDGVTATAICYKYLKSKGADVSCYIPSREGEGYGMSSEAVRKLAEQGTDLIITVDNGIRCIEEIALAKELGMDTVVTDHHVPGEELPAAAVALVDPHLPYCPSLERELCGAGVALMLISAVENVTAEEMAAQYGDLAALGTVADIMPLTGSNRGLVREGLYNINAGSNPALNILFAAAGGKAPVTAESLAYIAAPRVNAAGRMGDAAEALKLFISDDPSEMEVAAQKLCDMNVQRRAVEQEILTSAIEAIEQKGYKYDRVIVVSGDNWHPGVIGIVAASVCERYGKPAIVLSRDGDEMKGSGRSIEGFDLVNALGECEELFSKYGGHSGAAGLSMAAENEVELRRRINSIAAQREFPVPAVNIDCKLNLAAVNVSLAERLCQLEPFGTGNPTPLFGLYGVKIVKAEFVGEGKHTRLTVCKNDAALSVMLFSVGKDDLQYGVGDTVDLAVNISVSYFRGEERVSVVVKGIRPQNCDGGDIMESMQLYGDYARGILSEEDISRIMPNREEIGVIWRAVKASPGIGIEKIFAVSGMSAAKTAVCIDVLLELGLMRRDGSGYYINEGVKAELSNSRILNKKERQVTV